jgi:hypothetical protein
VDKFWSEFGKSESFWVDVGWGVDYVLNENY